MPMHRLPQAKAEASGAAIKNPSRFIDRKPPKRVRSLGEPYALMTEPQREAWADFQRDLPWLNCTHRPLVRMACMWIAKMDEGEFGVSATQALSSILSKLGATPVDETKVNHAEEDEPDPADQFFGRPH